MKKNLFKVVSIALLIVFCSIITLCACSFSKNGKSSSDEIKEKFSKLVVKLYCYDVSGGTKLSQGSAFYFDENGGLITNAHVVKDAYIVKTSNNIEVDQLYSYEFETSDYCILNSKAYNTTPVTFSDSYKVGDKVYSVGFPQDSDKMVVNEGKILYETEDDSKNYIVSDAFIDEGSSGGILVNAKGDVIGITTALMTDGNYGSISYSDFKDALDVGQSQELISYFHTTKKIDLTSSNFNTYFDVVCNEKSGYSDKTSAWYDIAVELKDSYLKRIYSDGKITVTFKITTHYTETAKNNSNTSNNDASAYPIVNLYRFNDYAGNTSDVTMSTSANTYYNNYSHTTSFSITSVSGYICYVVK